MDSITKTPAIKFTKLPLTADDTGSDPNGAAAEWGSMESGFGGLGLDGIVGNAPSGELPVPCFGEGKTGIASGGSAGGREMNGMVGWVDGETEMEE